MRIVVISGSRCGWPRPDEVRAAIRGAHLLIVGDAAGVDAIAWREAIAQGIEVERFRADWDNIGSGAGPLRNQKMVDRAAELNQVGMEVTGHAFPVYGSRGTHDCIRRLREAGFHVEVHEP